MHVPERQLLGAMRRAEGIAEVQDLQLARLPHLIDQSCGEPCRLDLLGVLQTTYGRLRG
jgi:hypothetical protein